MHLQDYSGDPHNGATRQPLMSDDSYHAVEGGMGTLGVSAIAYSPKQCWHTRLMHPDQYPADQQTKPHRSTLCLPWQAWRHSQRHAAFRALALAWHAR